MQHSFEVEAEPKSTALAVVEPEERQITTQNHWSGGSGVEGEIDAGDIRFPRINVPQKVGELGEKFTPGAIVLNKEVLLSNGETPLEMVVLRARKQYQEYLEFKKDGPVPKSFNTSEEVLAAGGHFNFGEKGYYRDIAHIMCVVPRPDSVSEEQSEYFIYEHEGRGYTVAMWTVASSAYTSVAKTVFSAALGHLRQGLERGKWNVTTTKTSNAKGIYFVPQIRTFGKTTPEFQDFAKSLLS